MNTWFGFVVKAGTPKDVLDNLHKELVKAINQPSFKEAVAKFGAKAVSNESIEEFKKFVDSEYDMLGVRVRGAGMKVQ